jgi:DNA modification methylase
MKRRGKMREDMDGFEDVGFWVLGKISKAKMPININPYYYNGISPKMPTAYPHLNFIRQ